MGKYGGGSHEAEVGGLSQNSSPSSMPSASPADYAPSPNTCSQALVRANQMRVQALLRQLLIVPANATSESTIGDRLNTLRVLRRTMREFENQLSWLTQVDFFETMERILRNETLYQDTDWRLTHDTTQLLIETLPRANFEPDPQTVGQILASVVQNLGHQRSEVRRASLLLINMQLNERRLLDFEHTLRIIIDYGLANGRNKQAQRGAILSLPLLMTKQVVEGEDLLPLIRCLSDLLVKSEPQLFYSLYLALQRLQMTLGDQHFSAYLRLCNPDAVALYKQAASRSGSMEVQQPEARRLPTSSTRRAQPKGSLSAESPAKLPPPSADGPRADQTSDQPAAVATTSDVSNKQVTFKADNQPSSTSSSVDQSELRTSQQQSSRGPMNSPEASGVSQDSLEHMSSIDYIPPADDGTSGLSSPSEAGSSLSVAPAGSEGRMGRPMPTGARFPVGIDQSSVSSTCSSEANLVDPVHYMNASALNGHPLDNYEQLHHIDHSTTGLAINDLYASCSPTMELGPAAQNELKFGIFPRHLVTAALGPRYLDRLEALEEMMCIIRDSPINHLAILMTYFDSFLGQFLAKLMDSGTDYKVELIAIDMIETIVIKTKFSVMQYIRPMVSLLVKSLGDPRALFRDNSVRVIHKMMAFLPPQHVIDAIFEHKHSRSPLVREESVNRVTAAVLEYDRNEFNLTKLCYHVLPMLADHQAQVRMAALECIATLAHALGPERIGSLLTAAEAVQTGCDYDGFLDAINARIMRRALPRCNADGSIRYVIKPFLNSSGTLYHQEHQAADVRWVLEAPSRHQHQQHGHQQECEPEFHSHRPGVYSPIPVSGPRRCSVPAALIHQQQTEQSANHQHHHQHHYQHQQQQQQQPQYNRQNLNKHHKQAKNTGHPPDSQQVEVSASGGREVGRQEQNNPSSSRKASCVEPPPPPPPEAVDSKATGAVVADSAGGKPRDSKGSVDVKDGGGKRMHGDQVETRTRDNNSEIAKQSSRQSSGSQELSKDGGRVVSSDAKQPAMKVKTSVRGKRSNSQDSSSSSDTNKVLFQYYLGKFRQSLEDNGAMQSVLPSDSIIYTDIVQAYELNRHQSRYQQTSFDYGCGPVGRIPVEPTASKSNNLNGTRKNSAAGHVARGNSDSASVNAHLAASDLEPRSGSDSSRSESPQTVMEQINETTPRKHSEALVSRNNQVHSSEQDAINDALEQQRTFNDDITPKQGQTSDRRASRHSSIRDRTLSGDQLSGQPAASVESQADYQANEGRTMDSYRKQSRQLSDQERQLVGRRSREEEENLVGGGNSVQSRHGSAPKPVGTHSQDSQETKTIATPKRGSQERKNEDSEPQQQPRSRGLVLQSASAVATDEHPPQADLVDASGVSSPEDDQMGARDAQWQGDTVSNKAPGEMVPRQESAGTTDSHSSQREWSDHATQTSLVRDASGDLSRQSRRRRSSKKREPREEPTKGDESEYEQQQVPVARAISSSKEKGQEEIEVRRRASRSQPPAARQRHLSRTSSRSHLHQESKGAAMDSRRSVSVSPSVATNVNIRHILENVAETEGAFQEPQLAFRVAMEALSGPCWSTKVEGILALIRLAAYHQPVLLVRLHEVVCRISNETRNLRSTVARSAIFALGDFCARLERSIEPEMETIVQALLQKSTENTAFIREDIRRALTSMVDHLTQWRLANVLIVHGSNHKNMHVRRMASQFVALVVERMGAAKCLVGARDISAKLIPAAAKFAQDSSPHTRYYGRLILARIMQHSAFERLLRKSLTPNLYRSTVGIVESIKRRGAGEPPNDV